MHLNKKKLLWIIPVIVIMCLLALFILLVIPAVSPVSTSLTELNIPCPNILHWNQTDIGKIADEWFQSPSFPDTSRSRYALVAHQGTWAFFCEAYEQAMQNDEPWIFDPIKLAMRLAGYPNIDNLSPYSVSVYYFNKNEKIASVIILSTNLMDDSVKDKEYRVDLVEETAGWKIHWAGYRQRCHRTLFSNWISGPCP